MNKEFYLNKKIGIIKMKETWNKIKQRRFDKKTEKLQKQALRYIKENEKLEQRIDEIQQGHQSVNEQRNDDVRQTEKECNGLLMVSTAKTNGTNKKKSDTILNNKDKLYLKEKRPRKRSTKRCYFCRKRGHLKKNCPAKQNCWNWMKGVQRKEWKSYN